MTYLRAILFLLILSPMIRADDWPQWLGPRRDGRSAEVIPIWKEAPKKLWQHPVGAGYCVPVIAHDRAFVHDRIPGKDRERVVAYDAISGKELWRDEYDRPPYSSVLNTGPQATPTISGKNLYTFGINGILTCYRTDTGNRVWQVDTYKKLNATLPTFGVTCSPLVIGNRVIVAVGGKGSSVAAFDTEKGELQWQALDEPAGTASPVLFSAATGRLPEAVFMTTLRLVGLNPLDGSISWVHPLVFQPSGTAPTPMVMGTEILTSTMTNGSTLIRLGVKDDQVTGAQIWQEKDLSGYFSSGVSTDDRLYLITNVLKPIPDATLRAVDRKTGKEQWKKSIGYFHAGLIRTGDNKLLILNDSGTLLLAEDGGKEFRQLATAKVCGGTLTSPALANGRLYVRDDTNVTCYRIGKE